MELELVDGCNWVVSKSHKDGDLVRIFCNKMVGSGSQFCPKHALMAQDASAEVERRLTATKVKREAAQAKRIALVTSPLRAENPDFDKGRNKLNGIEGEA
jgi:hypothetical protein